MAPYHEPSFTLRQHFELRKTTPLGPRRACARVFELEGALGLVDASGALWPVEPGHGLLLKPGSVCVFRLRFYRPDGGNVSKYDDSGFVCEVVSLEEETPRRAP